MSSRAAWSATLALAAAATVAPWWGHVDDSDAQLYRVVARHMVEDGTWFELRYLPGVHSTFREHLPFGLWPLAAVIRIAGEHALPALGLLFTLGTVALVMWMARRMAGPSAAIIAGLVLATTETFVLYGGRERLDPPLVFFATAAVAPLLVSRLGARAIAASALFGALAALVKGPFGLLPIVAAAVARFFRERTARVAALGSAVVLLAAVPVCAFLLYDRSLGGGTWWRGYVEQQLLASAVGHRSDGNFAFYFPVLSLAGRFWPGLPLVAFGAYRAVRPVVGQRNVPLRALGLCCLVVVVGLCLPARKLWNHVLVAYPLLALFGAVAVAPVVDRWLVTPARRRASVRAIAAVALVAWSAVLLGAGRLWHAPPTVACAELAPLMDRLGPGAKVVVASRPVEWRLISALAAERRIDAWPIEQASALVPEGAALLLWRFDAPAPPGWREISRARGWTAYEPAR